MHETLANAGHRTAQAGGLTSVLSALTSSEAGVVFGILIGVIGLAVQWYYRRKQDRREEAEHQLRMSDLREEAHK